MTLWVFAASNRATLALRASVEQNPDVAAAYAYVVSQTTEMTQESEQNFASHRTVGYRSYFS
jgi:hypothetical protein